MDTKINFDFVSPEELIVSSEVDMVLIPAKEGDAYPMFLGLDLKGGVHFLLQVDKDNIKKFLVEGGFVDVTPDKITILAESSLNLTDSDASFLKSEIDSLDKKIDIATDLEKELLVGRKELIENFR